MKMQLMRAVLFAGLVGLFSMSVAIPAAQAAPEVDLHDLTWFVHADLIDAGAGRDLPFWQGVIDDAMDTASLLVEGAQGPFDQPCCTRIARSASVATFGTVGDGFDIIDSSAEESALNGIGGSGSRAFLVDSITFCGGANPNAVGCAVTPSCNGNGNDDPNLWMTVTVDTFDSGTLAAVLAHERGHNACLNHVTAAKCQVMQPTVFTPGLGGCLSATECTNFQAARTQVASGLECGCHDDVGGLLDDGAMCTEVASGICSGGVCGDSAGDAGIRLLTAADPGDAALGPEHALSISGLGGNWVDLGDIGPSQEDIRAMAFATDSDTLYGVIPTVADDSIITIDKTTGAQIAVVGTIANGSDEIVSMAYDPGDTTATTDDRLLVLEASGSDGEFREIDPAAPSTAVLLGAINFGSSSSFTGMAYDSIQDRLFLSSIFGPSGIFEVDLSNCGFFCNTSSLPGFAPEVARENSSLAYSAETGMLYVVGNRFGAPNTQTFYTVIDPATGTVFETLNLDRFTPAALAAVPEPGIVMGITAGLLGLTLTARRSKRR